MKNKKIIISISGPTCVGKSSIAIFLAKKLNTEILSNDSRQFYKELKIGTSAPSKKELEKVQHHFIGHINIFQEYNAKLFEIDFLKKIKKLFKKYSILIMVGGSGLYEKSAIEGLSCIPKFNQNIRNNLIDRYKKYGINFLQTEFNKYRKKYKKEIDYNNPHRLIRYLEVIKSTGYPHFFFKKNNKRLNFSVIRIGITIPKREINFKINNRIDNMIKNGLLNEVEFLYPYKNLKSLNTIGYKEFYENNFFEKKNKTKLQLNDIIEKIKINTKKYVKRQFTWYKKYKNIKWFHPKEKKEIMNFIKKNIWAILDLNQ